MVFPCCVLDEVNLKPLPGFSEAFLPRVFVDVGYADWDSWGQHRNLDSRFANFIDEWSQCDFCLTNIIFESSIKTKKFLNKFLTLLRYYSVYWLGA